MAHSVQSEATLHKRFMHQLRKNPTLQASLRREVKESGREIAQGRSYTLRQLERMVKRMVKRGGRGR